MKYINVKGQLIDFASPKVMGILNITPDSFFEGSRYQANTTETIDTVGQMLLDGASFIDIGGYSTRPNAQFVDAQEEADRVLPAIEAIIKHFPEAIISIDTFRANVAKKAIAAGASIINDVSGGTLDTQMFETVAKHNVPYILMHSRGNPQTMSQLNQYNNLTLDVINELSAAMQILREMGVKDIIIDPGFGFAKDTLQNFELLQHLSLFEMIDAPLLVGVSRKSMIWKFLEITPAEALNGTTALNMAALMKGANILRVHDVKNAVETVKLYGICTST